MIRDRFVGGGEEKERKKGRKEKRVMISV